ncbi:MAG: UDP-N-acetylglucosamine 4,6-dehydratase (inverting) [Methanobrevibacter sp.]|nr:UDP-N-acetylglucosamine 4,6-dehydratase (inverting) [Methanobrevibacter sp.]
MFDDKTILITGGTGSFGKKFTRRILGQYNPKKIIIYSRDEYKQYLMQREFAEFEENMRYFIGDVRDKQRLARASDGVDIIVHAAALKQVPAAEYNPLEAIKTNIDGARNIVDVAIDKGVEKVVALSTDKAVNPVNLYGATKMVSDKLFIAANAYVGAKNTSFSVVRYGNVSGSRGSVIPFFKGLIDKGETKIPITDERMTRFWITLDEAVDTVIKAIDEAKGGELYIHKCPSFKVTDLAEAMLPGCEIEDIGIRPGEKLHEAMITSDDSRNAYEYDDYYIIYPELKFKDIEIKEGGKLVEDGFYYASNENKEWLTVEEIREALKDIDIVY